MTTKQDDYDNPWKEIMTKYFRELMHFFFPGAASDIDWSIEPVFLDKEFQQITRNAEIGSRRADKLVQVHTRDGRESWVLVHVEVQSQYEKEFAKRIYTYNYRIFDLYDRNVASLVILADENLKWKPSSFGFQQWGCKLSLEYPVAKLMDYKEGSKQDELDLKNDNLFSVVVQAHLETLKTRNDLSRRYKSKFSLIHTLYDKGYSRQEIIDLFAFIDWLMRLPEELERSLWRELEKIEEESKMPYITSVERIGIEKGKEEGKEEGRKEGARKLLSRQLTLKFKEKPDFLYPLLLPLSMSQLEELGTKIFEIDTFDQVKQWVNQMK